MTGNIGETIALRSEFSDLVLLVDAASGAPACLSSDGDDPARAVHLGVTAFIVSGGDEAPGAMGGLVYPACREVEARARVSDVREQVDADLRRFEWEVATSSPDEWAASWQVECRHARPRLTLRLMVHAGSDAAVARNVRIELSLRLPTGSAWRVHAPGNPIRPGLALADLSRPVAIAPASGVDGSAGLVALEDHDSSRTLLLWPIASVGMGSMSLQPTDEGVRLVWTTDVGGRPGKGGTLTAGDLHLDLVDGPFAAVLATVPDVLADLGLAGPADPPAWAVAASIYEVQVGFGVFAGGYRYGPYPEMSDLLADLDRIESLGYDTIQVMPRQPFPSYNAYDFADVTTNYGDERVLRQLVDECHRRGMRVILDILLHGVVDHEAVDQAVDAIRRGPWADRLDTPISDITVLDLGDPSEADELPISWAAHVVNFAPYWRAGSVPRHPLCDEHPEWFCRDSAGRITGMYSKAFDVAHPGWQRWFSDRALDLVRRLDIDGFRFDAPSYNQFHNWSNRTRTNAAVSMLGCLSLFELLRTELRALKTDALLYTEPSGALYRRTMDLTYNYDEQWLVRAVMRGGDRPHGIRNARELRAWLAERDASLTRGSLTAHHLDSHDTFWWPDPGRKWRREQYGLPAATALMTAFALCGGPYMTFVGGETGMEDAVRAVHRLRREHAAFGTGVADFDAPDVDDDDVFAVLRRAPGEDGLVLVNLAGEARTVACTLALDGPAPGGGNLLGPGDASWSHGPKGWMGAIVLGPYAAYATAWLSGGGQ